MQSSTLFVCYDELEELPRDRGDVLSWRRISKEERDTNIVSLMDFIDGNGEQCKSEFIAFCNDLKSSLGKCFQHSEKMSVFLGDELWKTSRFSELSNHVKSRNFDIVLKIIAMRLYVEKYNYSSVVFFGFPKDLNASLVSYFPNSTLVKSMPGKSLFEADSGYVRFIKSYIYLFILLLKSIGRLLKANDSAKEKVSKSDIIFVDYLYEFDPSERNFYKSRYWGELPQQLLKHNKSVSWLHIFVPHKNTPSLSEAKTIAKDLNAKNENHYVVDDLFSLKDIFHIGFFHFVLWQRSLLQRKKFLAKSPHPLWSLLEYDWIRSFESVEFVKNSLFRAAFENCLPDQMKSTSVVYICENQPWEYSLCRSSLVRGCENIVASLQATVRFWDLRYLQNVQKSHFINGRELFAPHYVASNSASVSEKMRMTPSDIIRQVESYRMGNVSSSDRSVENDDNVIIVAGEYSNSHTLTLLNAINKVGSDVLSSYSVYYRPHPSSRLVIPSHLSWLEKIPENYDFRRAALVVADANTSFSADCWQLGLNVACYVEASRLNMSPIYDKEGVVFFNDPLLLVDIFKSAFPFSGQNVPEALFNSNVGYKGWFKVLGLEESSECI